MLFEELKK